MNCLVSAQKTYMRMGKGPGPHKADENFVITREGEGFVQSLTLCSSLISPSDPRGCGAVTQQAACTAPAALHVWLPCMAAKCWAH